MILSLSRSKIVDLSGWYQLVLLAPGLLTAINAPPVEGSVGLTMRSPLWLLLMLMGVLRHARILHPFWVSPITLFFVRLILGQTRYLTRREKALKAGELALSGCLGNSAR